MFQPVLKSDIESDLRLYAADFETTTGAVSEDETRVWSFCVDEIGKFEPEIFGSISDFFEFCGDVSRGYKKRIYFHNLKFDGEFIIYSALHDYGMVTAEVNGHMLKSKDILNNEIVYAISDVGQWYFIAFKYNHCIVEIRDSLKLLPFTLKTIGKDICTRYRKSEMNYDDKTALSDCTPEDIAYIKNDVLVLSEALDKLMALHDEKTPFGAIHSLTIGGACWAKFKESQYGEMKNISIKLDSMELPKESGSDNADEYIRHGYRGGYCYLNKKIENQTLETPGFTADVNSLYPFVMCSEYSGFRYPYGKGKFEKGKVREEWITNENYYFYARIKVSFRLRPGFVPTIQKKGTFMFLSNLYLESSQAYNAREKQYVGPYNEIEITLSKDDYILFFRHYEILTFTPLDYMVFQTANGICDNYVKTMSEIKIEATKEGNRAVRTLAKLFSNNLYGQFSKGKNSSFKVAEIEDEKTHFTTIEEYEKKVTNIAIGAAVTAHARFYQINTIQNNISIFCYSDTDSLHCIGTPADFKGEIDSTKYGAYDIENRWTRARFVRQKTYIEENENGWTICAAGMTDRQKDYFRQNHSFEDFRPGLKIIGGKLQPKHVKGGVILKDIDFTLN